MRARLGDGECSTDAEAPQPAPADLEVLFRPRSLAIVGASETPGKWGNLMMRHVVAHYSGEIYPVNPRARSICGRAAYRSVRDLPVVPDLAVVGVARDRVADVVGDCAARGCKIAVIVTSGFADAGTSGRREQDRLVHIARAGGVRLVGPNCMGVYSAAVGLYASVGLDARRAGGVSLLSQSGNVGVAMFERFSRHGIGLHSFVGLGNQADVTGSELIAYLSADESCTVVAAYLEDVRDGRRLLDSLTACASRKPVVILRGGSEASGAAAARSHTGSLATPARLSQDLFAEAGAVVVDDLEELTTTALILSEAPRHRARRVAVLTDGGGFGVLAADEVDRSGLKMARVGATARAAMRAALPPYCTIGNPTDVGGDSDSDPSVFAMASAALLADPAVDALLVSGILGGYAATFNPDFEEVERRVAPRILEANQAWGKPVVVQSVWPVTDAPVLRQFAESGIPVVGSLRLAVRALGHLNRYVEWTAHHRGGQSRRVRIRGTHDVPQIGIMSEIGVLDEAKAYAELQKAGIKVPPFAVVDSELTALRSARRLGFPLVAKALIATDHKSELGGVVTGIATEHALRSAFRRLRKLSKQVLLVTQVFGVAELLVGGVHSERFGPIVSVGAGGLLTEAFSIAAFARAPLSSKGARHLLRRDPTIWRALETRRRGAPLAVDELVHILVVVGDLIASSGTPLSVELNPVILDERHAWVADAKIRRER